ncbi:UNVERIFIED_CONTAM: hypothetical protein Sradi_4375200 [Sesamum radiatum]|uniref:DUF4283 domain-containing protein n=1 Tax=Sesamum radiatum TaxID=300843 RepID=A0AAW2NNW3_SESRA
MEAAAEMLGKSLVLTEAEQDSLIIQGGEGSRVEEQEGYYVVGRLLSAKSYRTEFIRSTLLSVMNPEKGMTIRDIGNGRLLFKFQHPLDCSRMVEGQPWTFERYLIVLRRVEADKNPETIELNWCPFRVHIHGLPLRRMTAAIAVQIGNRVGRGAEIIRDSNGTGGASMRIKVEIDVRKPSNGTGGASMRIKVEIDKVFPTILRRSTEQQSWRGTGNSSANVGGSGRRGVNVFDPMRRPTAEIDLQRGSREVNNWAHNSVGQWTFGIPKPHSTQYQPISVDSPNPMIQGQRTCCEKEAAQVTHITSVSTQAQAKNQVEQSDNAGTEQIGLGQTQQNLVMLETSESTGQSNDRGKTQLHVVDSVTPALHFEDLVLVPLTFQVGQSSTAESRKPIRKFSNKSKFSGQKRKLLASLSSSQSKKIQLSNVTAEVATQPRRAP